MLEPRAARFVTMIPLLLLVSCAGASGPGSDIPLDISAPEVDTSGAPDIPVVLPDIIQDTQDAASNTDVETSASDIQDADAEELTPPCPPDAGLPGCPCDGNSDCLAGWCVHHMGERVCTDTCVDTCPAAWDCVQVGTTDPVFLCVSRYSHLCMPCVTDVDCESVAGNKDVCVDYGAELGRFCGGPCGDDDACPDGFACREAQNWDGKGVTQCVLPEGACDCTDLSIAHALATPCRHESAAGVCHGERVCQSDGLSACDAPIPVDEICANMIDDDCDGETDPWELCAPCVCGDGLCEPDRCGEAWDDESRTCATDCAVCGDLTCDAGEGIAACPVDCCGACGDGSCKGGECAEDPLSCPQDCGKTACGDEQCDPGENPIDCALDCQPFVCGNHTCEPGEDAEGCAEDCAQSCGDCACDGGETYANCPKDCGFCGDGYCIAECEHLLAEDLTTCVDDCCTPDCAGKECGDDGCGAPCGLCPAYDPCRAVCEGGVCGPLAQEETWCNGVDDDCDGETDEGFVYVDPSSGEAKAKGDPCGEGICAGGAVVCSADGAGLSCSTDGGQGGELCDGVDNDCDGLTDAEDPTDLVVSDPRPCETQAGVCFGAVKPAGLCGVGTWGPCEHATYGGFSPDYDAAEESRCDGLDNDCDGQTDEDFTLTSPDGITLTTLGEGCGAGVCVGGQVVCRDDQAGIACSTSPLVSPEVCDDLDNDCDGLTDAADPADLSERPDCEQQQGACVGAVTPAIRCVAGTWQACEASDYEAHDDAYEHGTELSCDQIDNDCDGSTDEDFTVTLLDGASVAGADAPCGVGACADGTTICDDEGAGLRCSSEGAATPEVCDGLDNDCDGLTDEDLPAMETTCGLGACATTGQRVCQEGALIDTCSPGSPSEEVCDGIDNDCDGWTDLDDADDISDEGFFHADQPLCQEQRGVCLGAVRPAELCSNGAWRDCHAQVFEAASSDFSAGVELACDGLDNDCDGLTDEDLSMIDAAGHEIMGVGAPCGLGACAGGVTICSDDGASVTCDTLPLVKLERCNGIDDDCDGLTDADDADDVVAGSLVHDQPSCEVLEGVCAGATKPAARCAGGAWKACVGEDYAAHHQGYQPDLEQSCDGLDNDCNGHTDEDFQLIGPDGSTSNGAGQPCGAGACAGGTTLCSADQIGLLCSTSGLAGVEICDGVDNDCDGLTDTDDDEDLLAHDGRHCEKQAGACVGTTKPAWLCMSGLWFPCSSEVYAAHAVSYQAGKELSCDGVDNDCDGMVDEDFLLQTPDGGVAQGVGVPCGVGACAGGLSECALDGVGLRCSTDDEATDEICDGVDNDCDGHTDAADLNDLELGRLRHDVPPCEAQEGVCAGAGKPARLCVQGGWLHCDAAAYAAHAITYEDEAEFSCDGLDNDCDGLTDAQEAVLAQPLCEDQAGACAGARKMSSLCVAGAWQACAAEDYERHSDNYQLVESRCDGRDNDCDDVVDEDYVPSDTSCGVGVCAATGQRLCREGAEFDTCTPLAPAGDMDELCDGLDDDCDGFADEDYVPTDTTCGAGACATTGQWVCEAGGLEVDTCVPGDGGDEICDGVDNDCDGLTDADDLDDISEAGLFVWDPQLCALQQGVCQGARHPATLCLGGAWQACDAEVYLDQSQDYQADVELSCDGIDNDCDGLTDEDFALALPDGGQLLGVGVDCGLGVCANGHTMCNPAGDGIVCSTAGAMSVEVCNGLDDDCDGLTDADDAIDLLLEDARNCEIQDGVCAGAVKPAERCVGGAWTSCGGEDYLLHHAAFELGGELRCDGLDNDCDGETDEDFDVLLLDGVTEVVGVGEDCGVGVCAGGLTTCNDTEDGVICSSEALATVELCNGGDDDCDGATDEDFVLNEGCGVGACEGGVTECDATGTGTRCSRMPGGSDARDNPEVCDTVDNDCDGTNNETGHELCRDSNACTVDICTGTKCTNNQKDCADSHACTEDSCSNGQCKNTPIHGNCNDYKECTQNICSKTLGCTYPPDYTRNHSTCSGGPADAWGKTVCMNGSCTDRWVNMGGYTEDLWEGNRRLYVFKKCANGQTHDNARISCEDLYLAGKDNWSLGSTEDLFQLIVSDYNTRTGCKDGRANVLPAFENVRGGSRTTWLSDAVGDGKFRACGTMWLGSGVECKELTTDKWRPFFCTVRAP